MQRVHLHVWNVQDAPQPRRKRRLTATARAGNQDAHAPLPLFSRVSIDKKVGCDPAPAEYTTHPQRRPRRSKPKGSNTGFTPHSLTPQPGRKTKDWRRLLLVLLLRLEVHAGFLTLLRSNRSGCGGQRVVAVTGLRERNNFADRINAGQQGHDTVPTERNTTHGRCAVLERIEPPPISLPLQTMS